MKAIDSEIVNLEKLIDEIKGEVFELTVDLECRKATLESAKTMLTNRRKLASDSEAEPCSMDKEMALAMILEATDRIKTPRENANGGGMQVGGAYWRLAKVLRFYLEPMLEIHEGKHAESILRIHGSVRPLDLPQCPSP